MCTTTPMAAALGKRLGDACPLTTSRSGCYAGSMATSRDRILESLARLPFTDAGELAIILGEPLATVHRALIALLKDGMAQRVSHGTAYLPSSHRYYLAGNGTGAAADALNYEAPSDFVRAYPVSRQWLTLLLRRMDAAASVYRVTATLSLNTSARLRSTRPQRLTLSVIPIVWITCELLPMVAAPGVRQARGSDGNLPQPVGLSGVPVLQHRPISVPLIPGLLAREHSPQGQMDAVPTVCHPRPVGPQPAIGIHAGKLQAEFVPVCRVIDLPHSYPLTEFHLPRGQRESRDVVRRRDGKGGHLGRSPVSERGSPLPRGGEGGEVVGIRGVRLSPTFDIKKRQRVGAGVVVIIQVPTGHPRG